MIYKLIHCLRHSSKTRLGILPEKKERETIARDTLSVFAGTICGQGPDYDRPRNLEINTVNTEKWEKLPCYLPSCVWINQPNPRTPVLSCLVRGVVDIRYRVCSRYRISVRYRDLFMYLSEHDDIMNSQNVDRLQSGYSRSSNQLRKKFHSKNPQEKLTLIVEK